MPLSFVVVPPSDFPESRAVRASGLASVVSLPTTPLSEKRSESTPPHANESAAMLEVMQKTKSALRVDTAIFTAFRTR
jgi:hypothetical protein